MLYLSYLCHQWFVIYMYDQKLSKVFEKFLLKLPPDKYKSIYLTQKQIFEWFYCDM